MINIMVQSFPKIPKFIQGLKIHSLVYKCFLLEQTLSQFKTVPASYVGLSHVFDNCLFLKLYIINGRRMNTIMEHLWNGDRCGVTKRLREEYIPLLVFVLHKVCTDQHRHEPGPLS